MSGDRHRYRLKLSWQGNTGRGTSSYSSYERSYLLEHERGASPIEGSADPAFRGDPDKWNPEEMLLASLAACHQLWYLHLCADAGVIVLTYSDSPDGVMAADAAGVVRFESVTLKPRVVIAKTSDASKALALHQAASEQCFIANSVNFSVKHEPNIEISVSPD